MGPPDAYTIRESARARHVRLQISLRDGVVVVVPRGFDRRLVPGLVAQKQRWLERAWARLLTGRGQQQRPPLAQLPSSLDLTAIGEQWAVEYHGTGAAHVAARAGPGRRLVVTGHTGSRRACIGALRRWLGRKAHQHLEPWLAELASEGGLYYNRVLIKAQRTRWASCTSRGTISLSLKLLFLPPELVRNVLLHELCHTVESNHSPRFWALLERFDPDWRARRKELRLAWRLVPTWLSAQ